VIKNKTKTKQNACFTPLFDKKAAPKKLKGTVTDF